MTTQLQSPPLPPKKRPTTPPQGRVRRQQIKLPDKIITLFDLPRVDLNSLNELRTELAAHDFDAIALELDEQRQVWLTDKEAWQSLDLLDIIRQKKGRLLSAYLALRTFQKRFGSFHGCEPGDDAFAAIDHAHKNGLPLLLIDRDMQITALRAWRCTPTLRRPRLALAMTLGVYRRTRTRQDAEDDKRRHEKLGKARQAMPIAAQAFLEERQLYMAQKLRQADAKNIALLISSVHADEVAELLKTAEEPPDTPEIHQIPPIKPLARMMPWLFSILIIALFVLGFAFGDPSALKEAMLIWAVLHLGCTAFFSALTLAHPGAIAAAALSSPFVSLNPALGAGMIGALAQAFLAPPSIAHIERVGDDITRLSGWWTNQLARLMLLFIAANLGSTIGTFAALAFFPALFTS